MLNNCLLLLLLLLATIISGQLPYLTVEETSLKIQSDFSKSQTSQWQRKRQEQFHDSYLL